jgi:hypothetical protein
MKRWDDPDDPPRSAGEVVQGLDTTWRFISSCLDRWPADEPHDTVSEKETRRCWSPGSLSHHASERLEDAVPSRNYGDR